MEKKFFKLTTPQQNIWNQEKMSNKNSSINHIISVMKLEGCLNEDLLYQATNEVVNDNDSFHIKIERDNESVYQYFSADTQLNINKKDIGIEEIELQNEIEKLKQKEISLDNLYYINLVFSPNNTYVLYKSHHLISDAWGMTLFGEQVKENYNKLKNHEEIKKDKTSYASFIEREEKYFKSNRYKLDQEFWKEYVKKIPTTKLFNDTKTMSNKAKRVKKNIDEKLFEKISKYCKEKNITEYAFFLGVVSTYFNKIYNVKNLTFGTSFINRQKRLKEFECTGMYVSTLPLNIEINNNSRFDVHCKKITTSNLAVFKHANYPYIEIQKEFNKATQSTNSIYEIGFSYQINTMKNQAENQDKGNAEWIFSEEQNNPLVIHITTLNNKKVINYDYLEACFEKSDIEKINEALFIIIDEILNGKEKLKDINILSKKDIRQLQKINNSGEIKKDNETDKRNVINIFEQIVETHPQKIAIKCGKEEITYQKLNEKINQIRDKLIELGIKKEQPVALMFEKSIDMVASMLAVLKANGCYVPMLVDEANTRTEYILNDCKPLCILTHDKIDKKIFKQIQTEEAVNVINVNKIEANENKTEKNVEILPNDVAYIIYTSGSTGNPKGVMVMHKNIVDLKKSIENDEVLKATEKDVSMSLLKYVFDASGIDIYTALLFGGKLVLIEKEDELNPEKVIEIMEKEKITRSFLIPTWVEQIAIHDEKIKGRLSKLRILGTGGETIKVKGIEKFLKKYPNLNVLNLYGPTETTMFTTYKVLKPNNNDEEINYKSKSIGKPIYGSRVAIVNENLELLPIGAKGELVIYEDENSIQNIAKGYLNLKEQTQSKFIKLNNPIIEKEVKAYRTGDIAKINDNLEIDFLGRDDDMIKVNGSYLVSLNEVDNQIQRLLGEHFESYPIAIPYKNSNAIILFIVNKEKHITLNKVKKYINKEISFFMRPKRIIEITKFPRNSSGKIDRKELKRQAIKYMEENNKIIEPKTQMEKDIYKYIKETFKLEEFSIEDDFIDDIGLDSLSLTSIYVYLEKYGIAMQDIYNNPNVKSLAEYVVSQKKEIVEPDLEKIQNIKILNNIKKVDMTNVLLTGVTGFLGIHILKDLLYSKQTKKVYCIIRNNINLTSEERFKKTVEYYFKDNKEIEEKIKEKVVIINGQITKKNLGLSEEDYKALDKNITTVINSAANVKHFAKPQSIRKDNVGSVNQLIEFCKDSKVLAHISTLSIAGFNNRNVKNKVFTEDTLYINQDFGNNPYLVSKFEAEKNIIEATNNQNLQAIIFRLGNIMPRVEDGLFQKNKKENVFLKSLKTIVDSKKISKELQNFKVEFSPVDECSKIIIQLLEKGKKGQSVYHILNDKEIEISKIIEMLSELGCEIKETTQEEFDKMLEKNSDEYTKEYILSTNLNKYSQEKTKNEMDKIKLQWSQTDKKYIENILKIIK